MCRNILDIVELTVDDIFILSYYTVDTKYDEEYFTKIMMIDNNITSAVSDKLKHLI